MQVLYNPGAFGRVLILYPPHYRYEPATTAALLRWRIPQGTDEELGVSLVLHQAFG